MTGSARAAALLGGGDRYALPALVGVRSSERGQA